MKVIVTDDNGVTYQGTLSRITPANPSAGSGAAPPGDTGNTINQNNVAYSWPPGGKSWSSPVNAGATYQLSVAGDQEIDVIAVYSDGSKILSERAANANTWTFTAARDDTIAITVNAAQPGTIQRNLVIGA